MKSIFLAIVLMISSHQNSLTEPPHKVLKTFKQKFPSATMIKWIEEDNKYNVTNIFMGKISKYVQDNENTWTANFMLGDRITIATFDLEGYWLGAEQDIRLKDIAVEEVSSAIKKDYNKCEILSVKIYNSPKYGTWYHVEGRCGNTQKEKSYDYIGLPFPPKQ